MRFLCIHGTGSNSSIMQMQTAALRYELEDRHEYDYVEGVASAPMSEDVGSFALPGQSYYGFYNPHNYFGLGTAIDQLDKFVATEGPYDAVMGFSAGAVLAAIYILDKQSRRKGCGEVPFRYAVFISSARSKEALTSLGMDPALGEIRIPTAHIWGMNDQIEPTGGAELSRLCDPNVAATLVHDGGHEFPREDHLVKAVHAIRRTLDM
ncbi:hypothetical protein DL765_009400 [Monosporascus sp. GIB2]|nr:hypothetical protein DL765_009400 [Monosporascus sp. GIB2]